MFEASRRRPAAGPSPLRLEALEARWAPAVLGGFVHEDCDVNGLFESSLVGTGGSAVANEIGIGASTLQLLDGSGQVIATTTSDASGRYQFTQRDTVSTTPQELAYELTFDDAKTGVTRTGTLQQFDPTLGTLLSVSVEVGGVMLSQVQLENLEDVAAHMTTELDGTISFQLPGITELNATAEAMLEGTLGVFDGEADFVGSSSRDFGVTELRGAFATATVSNPNDLAAYVGDGTVQVSETANVTACACGTGNLLAMVRSVANGRARVVYRYTPSNEIGPGQYTIVQTTQPGGYNDGRDTPDNINVIPGSEDTDRITVNVTSRTQTILTNHFGEMKQSSLAGGVYHDVDRSGAWSGGDQLLGGVSVQLNGTDAFGRQVARTVQTDGMGQFSFGGLTRGAYTMTEIQPAGYLQGTNTLGTLGGTIAADTFTVSVGCGEEGIMYHFGEVLPTPVPVPPPPPLVVPPPPQPQVTPPPAFRGKFSLIGRSWLDLV